MPCNDCKDGIPRYTHTLTVEKPGTTTDDDGRIDPSDSNWVTVGRIMARFVTKGGRESYVFKQVQATTTTVIMAQATLIAISLDPSWRLRFGDRKFNIVASYLINESGRVVQIEAIERLQS